MITRQSARLRRKRQTTPGLSQPGSYSAFNEGYVVESEASFLPVGERASKSGAPGPTGAAPDSRRARYAASPHRFTVEDSPILGSRRKEGREEEEESSGNDNADRDNNNENESEPSDTLPEADPTTMSMDPPNPRTPPAGIQRANRDNVVNRVRTSLFDILGSATRRPVTPHWRPVGGPRQGTGDGEGRRGTQRQNVRLPRSMPLSGPQGSGVENEIIYSDEEDAEEDSVTPVLAPVSQHRRQRGLSPLSMLASIMLLSLALVLVLDNEVTKRRGGEPAWHRFSRVVHIPDMRDSFNISARDIAERALAAGRGGLRILFRNAWPATPVPIPLDVVTRDELRAVLLPEMLTAARRAAIEETERVTREARALETVKPSASLSSVSNGVEFAEFAERYAADKDLPADFALASAGGSVIATEPSALTLWARFARAYATALVSSRHFTPTKPRSPSVVLSPDVLPGDCWAFDGSQGSLTIRLARPVLVSAVTIEHTPRRSVFSVSSALREFRIVGLPVILDEPEVVLGEFVFDMTDEATRHMQTFKIQSINTANAMRGVRVEILSNHGSSYTTVYRIRVHGEEDWDLLNNVEEDI